MVKFVIVVAIILVLSSIFGYFGIGDFLAGALGTLGEAVPFLAVPIQTIAQCVNFITGLPYVVKFLGIVFMCILIKWAISAFGAFGKD